MLTRVEGGPISAAPLGGLEGSLGGLLIEIVEKREGMRGRRPTGPAEMFAHYANVWRPLFGSIRWDGAVLGIVPG